MKLNKNQRMIKQLDILSPIYSWCWLFDDYDVDIRNILDTTSFTSNMNVEQIILFYETE